jgi:hypothetical protein
MSVKLIYLILPLFFACSSIQQKFHVANINTPGALDKNTAIYALPKTVLHITVRATRTLVIPGPYHEYADKYLGIKNVPDSASTVWKIYDVEIRHYIEADPEYYFSVKHEKSRATEKMISLLADDSLILLPDKLFDTHVFNEIDNISENAIYFKDLSVKRNIDTKIDTTYREVFRDSVYVSIPVLKRRFVNKSIKDKAEEAANFIIKIRKRRFKLLSGQYDYMPDGEALAIAVEELNRLEDEYLSLFTGKLFTEDYIKTIQYIPGSIKKESVQILFRFSEDEGFIELNDVKGKPVIIEINDLDRGIVIQHEDDSGDEAIRENTFWIRLPDLANIRLIFDKKVITEVNMPVFQFGCLVPYYVNGWKFIR